MAVSVCERTAAFWQGIRWGIGHSVGIGVVAIIVWILGLTLTAEAHNAFDYYGSLISGCFMIGLGLHFLRKVNKMKSRAGFVELSEQLSPRAVGRPSAASPLPSALPLDPSLVSSASHSPPDGSDPENSERVSVGTLSLAAGMINGAAGPGGMLAIMPASYYDTVGESFSYISVFMISSTLCMGCVALVYGNVTFNFAMKNRDSDKLVRGTYIFSSGMSIVLGVLWIVLTLAGVLGTGH